ncbi:DUF1801 domain-containing protein [Jeotgalibaca porci]|uniref:DUF1801 domain-containing protein n=1 Tax=Jeotgalibaca porci TaxID=1868793 RepID=UPI0035A1AE90
MEHNDKVDQFIAELSPEQNSIVLKLREILANPSFDLTETYKWSSPTYENNGLVAYIKTAKAYVSLGFYKGFELVPFDSSELLEGSGNTLRHLKFRSLEDIYVSVIEPLITQAINLNLKTINNGLLKFSVDKNVAQ